MPTVKIKDNDGNWTPIPLIGGDMKSDIYDPTGKATDTFKYTDDAVEKHILTANRDVYVSNDGSDETGDGTQEKPWATIQKAVDEAPEESGAYTYEINVPIGSYAGFAVSGKRVHIYGAAEGITITSKISVVNKGHLYVSPRFTFSPADNGIGLSIYSCGYAEIMSTTFNNCSIGISVGGGGQLYVRRTTTLAFNNCTSAGISVSSGGFACIMGTISGTGNKRNMSVSGGIISYGFYRAEPGTEPDSVSRGGIITNNLLDVSQKGIAGGLATLDDSGKVPGEQLPAMDYDPVGSADAAEAAAKASSVSKAGDTMTGPLETTGLSVAQGTSIGDGNFTAASASHYKVTSPVSTGTDTLTLDKLTNISVGVSLAFQTNTVTSIKAVSAVDTATKTISISEPFTAGQYSTVGDPFSDVVLLGEEPAFSLGRKNHASHVGALASGFGSVAAGAYSQAQGHKTRASGTNSHAEGASTLASAVRSHAEGDYTTASGDSSHAEGSYTTASGAAAHAEGDNTVASAIGSHAGGLNTIASADYSTIVGMNGETALDTLFAVANGIDTEDKHLAFEVKNDGSVIVDKTPVNSTDVANKAYVDSKSAYQQAVAGGYTGTEAEFQAILKTGPWLPLAGGTIDGNLILGDSDGGFAKLYFNAGGAYISYASGGEVEINCDGLKLPDIQINGVAAPNNPNGAANKTYVDAEISKCLPNSGGAVTGTINMYGNSIHNIGEITAPDDVRKIQVQSGLNMWNNSISNVAAPTDSSDAANKEYVDSKTEGKLTAFPSTSITIAAAGWTGTGPWVQTVSVSGLTASIPDDRIHVRAATIAGKDAEKANNKAMALLWQAETVDGGIKFTCRDGRPETDIKAVVYGEVSAWAR